MASQADDHGHLDATTSRDVIFCHSCEHEWYRDTHGLECPACYSNITEVVEPDNDPRDLHHISSASTSPEPGRRRTHEDDSEDEQHFSGTDGLYAQRTVRGRPDQNHLNTSVDPIIERSMDIFQGFRPTGQIPPSLRRDPAPQPAMATFDSQPQAERRAPTQASSYWSVSESNDFPHLLRSFGSDWTAIAAHMGSKTAVMVKNYFVRQKDQGKTEWDAIVQEADSKRFKGERRPEPPPFRTRYDNSVANPLRPIVVAPDIDLRNEPAQQKIEVGQSSRGHPFGYAIPIALAPAAQAIAQPPQQMLATQPYPPLRTNGPINLTISKDNTAGECARQADLFAYFGTRLRNRAV